MTSIERNKRMEMNDFFGKRYTLIKTKVAKKLTIKSVNMK